MRSTRIGLIVSTSVLAAISGTTANVAQAAPAQPNSIEPAAALNAATRELSSGSPVRAREMLLALSSLNMSESERTRTIELLQQSDDKVRAMEPRLVNLQRAKLALDRDDLATAERLATGVSKGANDGTKAGADALLKQIKVRRSELGSGIDAKLADASTALNAREYARCKGMLQTVSQWGVELSPVQRDALDLMQGKIVAIEQEKGRPFKADDGSAATILAAGMLADPGVIERRSPEPEQNSQQVAPATLASANSSTHADPEPAQVPPAAAPAPVMAVSNEDPVVAARKIEATSLLSEADQAFNDSKYNEAQAKYSRLRTQFREFLTPEQAKTVEDRLAESKLRLRGTTNDSRDLSGFVEQTNVARQQAEAEFNNQLTQAADSLKSGDVIRARDSAARARLILNSNRERFAETEFQSMQGKVSAFLKDVDTKEQELAATQAQKTGAERQAEAKRVADQGASERNRKVREAIDRVRALQIEMKYEEALQVVDQILFLDPINPTGLLLRDVLTSAKIYKQWYETNTKRNTLMAEQALESQTATLPNKGIIDYPTDWPEIIKDRGEPVTLAESVETRITLSTLANTRRPVDFTETPLEKAVDWVAKTGSVKMDVDWPSLEKIGINKDTPVTVNLSTIRLDHLLDLIVSKVSPDPTSSAAWEVQDGVLRFASAEAINKSTLMVIYDIRDLLIEVPDYNNVPQFDLNSALQSSGGGGSGSSPFSGGQQQQQGPQRTQEERTDELVRILTEQVDPDNWRENGGAVGFVSRFKGNLLITNTPKNHRAIGSLLRRLREIRAMQVNSESRFLLVAQDFFEQIGFDIDVYLNNDNLNLNGRTGSLQQSGNLFVDPQGVRSTINPTLRASDFFDPQTGAPLRNFNSQPTPNISNLNSDGTFTIGNTPVNTSVNSNTGFGPVGMTSNSLGIVSALTTAPFAAEVAAAGRAFAVAGTFLDDVQVDFLIEATQADRRNVSLQAPRLTTTNGQQANIQITNQLTYISGLTPITNQSAVAFQPITSTLNTGVLMLVRGTISADRRYVTTDITTQISQLVRFRTGLTFAAVAGGGLNGGGSTAIPSGEFQLPEVQVSSVSTTVTIPDQGTILLGGQRIVTEQEVESGVPVLSKIPVLNRFFSNRTESKSEQTLLILYKPTILIQSEQENKAHPGLIDSLDAGLGS
ncbi:MAG: hypothetical protein JNK16_15615 [Phycisphaerales bacterium]|nr:hypothetical protein [Phycisphaerales bacterium]